MTKDITPILEGWDYKLGKLSVRKITGIDGKEKIQQRLALGLLQMEVSGRPDGKKPYGKESLLDFYLSLLEEHKAKHGTDEKFGLDREDCAKLGAETLQYYHRRVSFLALGEYEKAIEDAKHNLRIMDLKKRYALEESDRLYSQQYRAFVIMQRTQAEGLLGLQRGDYDQALEHINRGIGEIEEFLRSYDREDLIEKSAEIAALRDLAEQIAKARPSNLIENLQKRLQEAIDNEEFERAAELRDLIRRLE